MEEFTEQEAHIEALELGAAYLGSMDLSHGPEDFSPDDWVKVIKACTKIARQLQLRADNYAKKHGYEPSEFKY